MSPGGAPPPFHCMSRNLAQSHFELFGVAPAYRIATERLEQAYREIQARIHPDRYARAGDAEKRASLQWTTRVNEAYTTLKDPVRRAAYLLELNGVDCAFESNTAMPAEFLMRQLELREMLDRARTARDTAALERLQAGLRRDAQTLESQIERAIDDVCDYAGAAGLVRKLRFHERLDHEIGAAFEAMEG